MKSPTRRRVQGKLPPVGSVTFAAISAVEGMTLSPESRQRFQVMKKQKLTAEEKRTAVLDAYSTAKKR